jgi:hypothetical protein
VTFETLGNMLCSRESQHQRPSCRKELSEGELHSETWLLGDSDRMNQARKWYTHY